MAAALLLPTLRGMRRELEKVGDEARKENRQKGNETRENYKREKKMHKQEEAKQELEGW